MIISDTCTFEENNSSHGLGKFFYIIYFFLIILFYNNLPIYQIQKLFRENPIPTFAKPILIIFVLINIIILIIKNRKFLVELLQMDTIKISYLLFLGIFLLIFLKLFFFEKKKIIEIAGFYYYFSNFFLIIPLIFFKTTINKKDFKKLIRIFLIIFFVIVFISQIFALLQYCNNKFYVNNNLGRYIKTIINFQWIDGNVRILSWYSGAWDFSFFNFFYLNFLFFYLKKMLYSKKNKIILILLSLFTLMNIFYSYVRNTYFAVFLLLIFYIVEKIFMKINNEFNKTLLYKSFFIFILLSYFFLFFIFPNLNIDFSNYHRSDVLNKANLNYRFNASLKLFNENIYGKGVLNILLGNGMVQHNPLFYKYNVYDNNYFDFIFGGGILLLISFIIFIFCLMKYLLKNFQNKYAVLSYEILMFFLGLSFINIFNNYFMLLVLLPASLVYNYNQSFYGQKR